MATSYQECNNFIPLDRGANQDVHTDKWSDLHKDVLLHILRYLNPKTDLPRLRGVCSSWRSALPDPADITLVSSVKVPNLLKDSKQPFILVESKFNLLCPLFSYHEASGADFSCSDISIAHSRWLTRMVEIETNKWHLVNPLNIQDLFMTCPPIIGTISLSKCRVQELAAVYSLVDGSQDKLKVISEKVVVLETPFTVLALLEGGRLVWWRTGGDEWTQVGDDYMFADVASYQGNFYAYDLSSRKIMVIDPVTFSTKFINSPSVLGRHLEMVNVYGIYLVSASNGHLYLAFWVHMPKECMFVFILKEDDRHGSCDGDGDSSWEQVMSLGDQIFFIGTDVSFSVLSSLEYLPRWKPGSICLFIKPAPLIFDGYSENEMPKGAEGLKRISYAEYFRYFMIFDMEKENGGCMIPFEELPKQAYTGILFPPPPWVKWYCPSLNNVEIKLDHLEFHGYSIDEEYHFDYDESDDDDNDDDQLSNSSSNDDIDDDDDYDVDM